MSKWDIDPPDAIEPVHCPICAGSGYEVEHEGYQIFEWCHECWGSGEVDPARADKLARERASCVSISSYLDDR